MRQQNVPFELVMKRLLVFALAVTLGGCTVPNFGFSSDDTCRTQTATGKTCGGSCPACADGEPCAAPSDCTSAFCNTAGVCAEPASCSDQQLNGTETDLDCGGNCGPCKVGAHCLSGGDCSSGACESEACAAAPSCNDGVLNGTETDLDCGGSCGPCGAGAHCASGGDCGTGVCTQGICKAADASCSNLGKDPSETDVDCGGPSCPACVTDKQCLLGRDCVSLVCDTVCQPPSCKDGVRNGTESAVDCGGVCAACDDGGTCNAAADCKSLSCTGGQCQSPACTDGVANGNETGKDCGGPCPSACPAGEGCATAADCQSSVCMAKVCQPASCIDQVQNGLESATDCGKGCPGCGTGQPCNSGSDCASTICKQKLCVPMMGIGGLLKRTGWTATASDTLSISSPTMAIDGDIGSRWTTGANQTPGMWLQVDMQTTQIFFGLTLDCSVVKSDAALQFDVFVSNSTSQPPTYSPVPAATGASSGADGLAHVAFDGGAQVARYIKVVLTKPSAAWWSISELTVSN